MQALVPIRSRLQGVDSGASVSSQVMVVVSTANVVSAVTTVFYARAVS